METGCDRAPLLSVTVLNYNYGHFLPVCLDSILSQSFTDFELILINDKSTDNSLEVIQPYLSDRRIRLIDHETNKGFVASLIEGAELSRGKYITVISADDWVLDADAFQKQIDVLEKDDEISFVYTGHANCSYEGKKEYIWRNANTECVRPGIDVFLELVLRSNILHSGTIIRKTAYDTIGGYDPSFRSGVDFKMWLGLCHTGKVAYIDDILYAYRRHASSMSHSITVIRTSIEESLSAIDYSFAMLPPEKRKQFKKIRTKAIKNALVGFAIDTVFQDHYQVAWINYRIAMQIRPFQTLFQKTTLLLALRIIFGADRFAQIWAFREWFSRNFARKIAKQIRHSTEY